MQSPMYEQIKQHLLNAIETGELKPGDQVPSENQLVEEFNVSRMTARRALQELSDGGYLLRTQGIGTFVADTRPMSSILEIRSIAEEIKSRGHVHSSQVIVAEYLTATENQARLLGIDAGNELFRSVIVHFENGLAVQYEDRLVNPRIAPGYLNQDFAVMTPNEYLSRVAPITEADHMVEAVMPNAEQMKTMDISADSPCLKVVRRTMAKKGVVSYAELVHPGNRYRLGGHLNFEARISKPNHLTAPID